MFSIISNVKLKKTIFSKCNLSESDFTKTSLNNLDLSDCEINQITIYPDDLKGCILNEYQAFSFIKLLGIRIKGNE